MARDLLLFFVFLQTFIAGRQKNFDIWGSEFFILYTPKLDKSFELSLIYGSFSHSPKIQKKKKQKAKFT